MYRELCQAKMPDTKGVVEGGKQGDRRGGLSQAKSNGTTEASVVAQPQLEIRAQDKGHEDAQGETVRAQGEALGETQDPDNDTEDDTDASSNRKDPKFSDARKNFAVIYIKFKQNGQTLGYFIKKSKQ